MSTSISTSSISDEILTLLPHRVGPARLQHIRGVVDTAVSLAERFQVDPDRARLAAVAHDMDRDLPDGAGFARAADWHVALTGTERMNPALLHGPISAERLRREYVVTDYELLHAIRHHTLGSPEFAPIGLILYSADFCEPGRTYLTAEERRTLLHAHTLEGIVRSIILYAKKRFRRLDPITESLLQRVSGEQ